jgi:hypothetical protein
MLDTTNIFKLLINKTINVFLLDLLICGEHETI